MKLGKFNSKGSIILGALAVIGVAVTSVLVAKDTMKLVDKLDEFEKEGNSIKDMEKKEVAIVVADTYKDAIITGLVTSLCIFGCCYTYSRTNKQLLTTLALSDDLINRTKKLAGETLNSKDILNKSSKEGVEPKEPESLPEDYADVFAVNKKEYGTELWHDLESGVWFYATEMEVINAAYHFNRNFTLGGCRDIGEFYSFLGIKQFVDAEKCKEGFSSYWFMESGLAPWIDIWWQDDEIEDMQFKKLYFAWPPIKCYEEYEDGTYDDSEYEYPRE